MDRIQILDSLRAGEIDVLIGVNLLREGLDLPEVSLVAIIDADKEGFLRSHRSLTQTVGRAARNLNGTVIMYADKITDSMQLTIDETERRRAIQLRYNEEHGIVPKAIVKERIPVVGFDKKENQEPQRGRKSDAKATKMPKGYSLDIEAPVAADPVVEYMSKESLMKAIEKTKQDMVAAAKNMDFISAAQLRDEMLRMEDKLQSLK